MACENCRIDPTANLTSSQIGNGSQFFRFANVTDSTIGEHAVVGDFTRVTSSTLGRFTRLDRFSLLYHSVLGDYSYTGPFDMIMHSTIGRFTSIAWGITIGPGEHDASRLSSHDFLYNPRYGLMPQSAEPPYDRFASKCEIGSDVWIGANVTILRGVALGHGSVVGANSTVTKDIPPYAIAYGSPARVARYRFGERIVGRLLSLSWWDFPPEKLSKAYAAFVNPDVEARLETLECMKG